LNNQTEEFLQLYKRLEYDGRRIYFPNAKENDSIIGRLISTPHLKKFKQDLDYCRVVRNFLTHNPKVNGVYPIVPSIEMIKLLENCIKLINNPPKAIDYAIPFDRILTARLDYSLIDVVNQMNRFTYTHVPILDNDNDKKVIGIFSDNTVYSYICNEKSINITNDTKIGIFEKYIGFDDHLNEYFAFVKEDTLIYDIEELFKDNYNTRRHKLLSVVYITKNGKREDEILGMLTPWDLIYEKII